MSTGNGRSWPSYANVTPRFMNARARVPIRGRSSALPRAQHGEDRGVRRLGQTGLPERLVPPAVQVIALEQVRHVWALGARCYERIAIRLVVPTLTRSAASH